MNISLGGAVSPSTKRGRSRRMPGAATAANRDVAPSRAGKDDARGETGRQPCPSTASRRLCPLVGRQECSDGQVNQTSHAIDRVELDGDGQNQRSEIDK